MQDIYFFGYGSLVNAQTHEYAPVHRATARGWRRAWRYTADRQVAYLTAIRDDSSEIDGLIAPVPSHSWAELDFRERAYERLPAAHDVTHDAPRADDIAIYAIAPERLNLPDDDHPVLLSYVDVVLQGYLQVYGVEGAQRFLHSTTGWEAPILNDRTAPRYPRQQVLTDAERSFVDSALQGLNCRIIPS
ncbi:MAG: gamma-glutamylcyclotransferase [Pelagimonas sp.]|jgi:hypothetical protein|nr:gamma-glutamylcyclotransferase [Pelagimonas sp.]